MIVDSYDWDDLDNHHPTCPNGCGQLADECMCNWPGYVKPTHDPYLNEEYDYDPPD